MIEAEQQRRWWFANHPEFSSSHTGQGRQKDKEESDDRISPEAVDAYVDDALKYETDEVVITLLKAVKRWFGTQGQTAESDAELGLEWDAEASACTDFAEGRSASDEFAAKEDDGEKNEATFWDAVLRGIDNTLQDWERWLGLAGGMANPSRTLARNLEKAGIPRPPGHDAHHIVSARDARFPEAKEARDILEKFGIGINDATNGVWLPSKPDIGSAAYHRALHAAEYYREVSFRLGEAKTRSDAIGILERIGRELANNTFFFR